MKRTITLLCSLLLLSLNFGYAQSADTLSLESMLNMSLEELMNVEVKTGNMTGVKAKKSPAAVTTITREQIEASHTRNLAALLETYVPGMVLMTHNEGDIIGIRGLIAAENYKLLLLVNGQNITNMVYQGVITEIDTWDLNDVERVEVIRGPGSVTYGTGAIAGVINIITKQAKSGEAMITAGLNYNPVYRSQGGSVQFSKKIGDLGIYAYGSIMKTLGQEDPNYYKTLKEPVVGDNGNRFMEGVLNDDGFYQAVQPYLADGGNRPQIKLHADVNYKDTWRLWTRYTQSGQGHSMVTLNDIGELASFPSTRSFAFFPEYNLKLNDKFSIKSTAGFDSQEYIRVRYKNTDYPIDHYNNRFDYAFSQNRFIARSVANYSPVEKLKLVAGVEYNHTEVAAPWFKGPEHLWVREGEFLINSKATSVYYNDEENRVWKDRDSKGIVEVGDNIAINTYSFLFESSYQLSDIFSFMVSARLDKPDIAGWMFSPRFVFISEINNKNTVRLSAQRSLRMLPSRAQYLYNEDNGESSDFEQLDNLELAYTSIFGENLLFNANVYFNNLEAVGYTGSELQLFGDQGMMGVELDLRYKAGDLQLGFNHSHSNLLYFNWNEEIKNTGTSRNNITFSDYNLDVNRSGVNLNLQSYGSSLNNWSNNSSRIYATYKLLDNKLALHANTRIFWDYEGAYDEMRMYEAAYENAGEQDDINAYNTAKAHLESEKALLEEAGAYQTDFRVSASISYSDKLSDVFSFTATLYGENLAGQSKRYYVSTGSNQLFPTRLQFIDEPTTVGVRLQLKFL